MVVEGLTTAPVLRDLARRLGVELPITEAVCRCSRASTRASSSRGSWAEPRLGNSGRSRKG